MARRQSRRCDPATNQVTSNTLRLMRGREGGRQKKTQKPDPATRYDNKLERYSTMRNILVALTFAVAGLGLVGKADAANTIKKGGNGHGNTTVGNSGNGNGRSNT